MNRLIAVGGAAVALVIAIVIGTQLLAGPGTGGTGAVPSATPSARPSATAAASVAAPMPSPTPALPLTASFTSTLHGISMSYPEEWTAQAATAPWTGAGYVFGDPIADFLYDPILEDHLFLTIASQRIGDSTPNEWVAQKLTPECAATEPIAVDGATGLIGADDCNVVAVTIDGRGYFMGLYTSGDEAWLSVTYDRAWFEEVLATVQLVPDAAVDVAPSASP
jgi:hypothetical protein